MSERRERRGRRMQRRGGPPRVLDRARRAPDPRHCDVRSSRIALLRSLERRCGPHGVSIQPLILVGRLPTGLCGSLLSLLRSLKMRSGWLAMQSGSLRGPVWSRGAMRAALALWLTRLRRPSGRFLRALAEERRRPHRGCSRTESECASAHGPAHRPRAFGRFTPPRPLREPRIA